MNFETNIKLDGGPKIDKKENKRDGREEEKFKESNKEKGRIKN